MHDVTERLAGGFVTTEDAALEGEFEALLVGCSTLAFRIAYSVLRNRQDAEDTAQDAFARAHRSFRQLRDRDAFRSWLVRMVWRMALDRRRAEKRRALRDTLHGTLDHGRHQDDAAEDMLAQERKVAMWQAIDALPERLRRVLVLASIEEHDLGEVAKLMDLPIGTVKSRLFAARQRLKEQLQWLKT